MDGTQSKELPRRRCDYCKEWFTPERRWQKFDSLKCRNGWHNDIRAVRREKKRNSVKGVKR